MIPGNALSALGARPFAVLRLTGEAWLTARACLRALRQPRTYLPLTFAQARDIGVASVPLVAVVAMISGAVTSQQTGYQFTGSLPVWIVGSVVAASVITELGPVITGLVLAGRVGARIGAELGTMAVTDQLGALQAVGRDPVLYLVVPRVLAGLMTVPALVAIADGAGLLAGWALALLTMPVTTAEFTYGVRWWFHDFALWFSLLKGLAFGLAITFIACLVGLRTTGGAEGVGRAATSAVVSGTVAVMVLDVIFVRLLKVF